MFAQILTGIHSGYNKILILVIQDETLSAKLFFCLFFQTVYDEWFITLYNLMYTALPVLGMSLFDQVTTLSLCM